MYICVPYIIDYVCDLYVVMCNIVVYKSYKAIVAR